MSPMNAHKDVVFKHNQVNYRQRTQRRPLNHELSAAMELKGRRTTLYLMRRLVRELNNVRVCEFEQ